MQWIELTATEGMEDIAYHYKKWFIFGFGCTIRATQEGEFGGSVICFDGGPVAVVKEAPDEVIALTGYGVRRKGMAQGGLVEPVKRIT